MGLGVEDGLLKFVWAWQNIQRNIVLLSYGSVADGAWHTITLNLIPQNISLWIDNQLVHTEMSELSQINRLLTTDGIFYIGKY